MRNITLAALPLALLVAPSAVTEPVPEWPDLEPTKAWGLTVGDWNADGVDDVLVNNHRDGFPSLPDWHDLLLVSDGNTWRVELELPFADRHGCTALDADADGSLDFFCAVGAEKGAGVGPNELWLQEADGWNEVAEEWGIDNPTARGRHVAALDWNDDGGDDLFVGIAPDPDDDQHAAVWLNRGDRFEPVSVEQWGTHCAVPWRGGVVVCDVGPALGEHAWWLRDGHDAVDLGEYFGAAVVGDQLALLADDHVSIDGERVDLPRAARNEVRTSISANGHSVYVAASGCHVDDPGEPVDLPDMVLTNGDGRWVAGDAPNGAGCTTALHHVGEQVLVYERSIDGASAGPRLWLP